MAKKNTQKNIAMHYCLNCILFKCLYDSPQKISYGTNQSEKFFNIFCVHAHTFFFKKNIIWLKVINESMKALSIFLFESWIFSFFFFGVVKWMQHRQQMKMVTKMQSFIVQNWNEINESNKNFFFFSFWRWLMTFSF